MSLRRFAQRSLMVVLASLATIICLEIGLRLYEEVTLGIPFLFSAVGYNDSELGWKGTQVFGNLTTDKFRILILGDSFTEASLLSREEVYYQIVQQRYDVELFVYAAAGYGTVQEYLAFTRFVDRVKPDLVLLQVTANDIINNSLSLETQSFFHNNLWLRPYWEAGTTHLAYPSHFGQARYLITQHSRLGYRTSLAIDRIIANLFQKAHITPIESVEAQQKHSQEYTQATNTTQELLNKMRQKLGTVPLVLLPATLNEPELNQRIRGDTDDAHWLDRPAREVMERTYAGEQLLEPDNTHWNATGHAVVGNALADELLTHHYIPEKFELPKALQ